jgi:hypothetical protein
MATLGLDALNWTRRLLEAYEKSLFAVSGDPNTAWVPPSQEALERLEFLSSLYCHLREVVAAETKQTVSFRPDVAQPSENVTRAE